MANDAEEIQQLIGEGDYWRALGLKPASSPEEIVWKIMELKEEYLALGSKLNGVQTALTQKRDVYNQAYILRDQLLGRIKQRYGPDILQMESGAGNNRFSLRADLWRQLNQDVLNPSQAISQALINMTRTASRFEKEIDTAVAQILPIRVGYDAFREGKIHLSVFKKDCPECMDKREITCPVCKGRGKVERQTERAKYEDKLEALTKNNPILAANQITLIDQYLSVLGNPQDPKWETVTCNECKGKGKVSCDCAKEGTLTIPKPLRKGQVVLFTAKSKRGSSEKTFARLDFSWGRWALEFILHYFRKGLVAVHPFTTNGQVVLFTVAGFTILDGIVKLGRFPLFSLLKAGFQGLGQSFGLLGSLIKSFPSVSTISLDPLTTYGILLVQALTMVLIGANVVIGKYAREAARSYSLSYHWYRDPTQVWLLNTGQYLTSRWILLLFLGLIIVAGFSSIIMAIFQSRIGMGIIGVYSMVVGITGLNLIIRSFTQRD